MIGATTMKTVYVILLSLLFAPLLQAQDSTKSNNVVSPSPKTPADTAAIQKRIEVHADVGLKSPWRRVRDSIFYTKYNKYGDLKDDDPVYNPKRPWWTVALKVTGANVFTTSVDHYVFRYDFSNVGFNTWKHNLKTGWEWDIDRFGMNFFFHPYGGAGYYNSALSSGYNFYQAIPFAVCGSAMYEYFGENTLPSYNDIVNTSISGAFFGEILYRLSSNILDDRATGSNRFFRELAAAAVNPSRAFGRLTSGQMWRHTSKEIYQKEPLNITLSTGLRKLNDGSSFGTGSNSATFNLHVDYGNPFEKRSRKPFDYFKMRTDLNIGVGRKIVDNITGLGVIYANNVQLGSMEMLVGLFQHYDFWDNKTFELGTIMFGGGVVSKLPLTLNSNLYTSVHVGIVPLAGNSTKYGPDTAQVRDYNYDGGAGGKLESTLEFGGRASLTFIGYYYWLHTYVGHREHHYIGIIRPRFEVRLIKNYSLGVEHLVYYSDRYPVGYNPIHQVRTEQRLYLKVYFEQFKRKD
jgi:hypothetical protein